MKVRLLAIALVPVVAGLAIADHIRAVREWAVRPAPDWANRDLFQFLKVVVPVLFLVHLSLALINRTQQRNSAQRSLTRFLFSKVFFWAVVEFALYQHKTNLWVVLDAIAFAMALVASLDILVRLFRRYAMGRLDHCEVLP